MDIKGYENYTIDIDGNIWSKKKNRYIRQSLTWDGYNQVGLYIKPQVQKKIKVHRLVALTYLPNIFNKPCVDHINRNRSDNRLFNLRWVTYKENSQNCSKSKNNKSGYTHIHIYKNYFTIEINKNGKKVIRKKFSCNKWTIEQVVKIRDDYLKELDSTENLPFTNQTTTLNRRAS